MEANACLRFSRIPRARCSGMATSGAGFLLPMETASHSAHPCPDSPNPPSAVTLRSLPSLLSVRISLWQIFTSGCFAAGAVSQGRWRGPMPWRRCWRGQDGGYGAASGSLGRVGPPQPPVTLLCRGDPAVLPRVAASRPLLPAGNL